MNKKRILLVDDEKDMVFAVKMQLEAENFEVLTAADGQEALDKTHRDKTDIIILDVMLPKIDGYKVCRMLKFDKKYKNIPIIVLTARVQETDKKVGYEVGADVYLTKPFEPKALLDEMNRLLKE